MRRRQFLWTTCTALIGSSILAGCIGGKDTIPGEEYPALDEWLSETEVGGADDTYDGTIFDRTGEDEVQVEAGVKGNRGNFAFGPSAVAITSGTTVRWVWTGEGGGHNIVADPEDQIGESDYEFSSGELMSEANHEYTQTLDNAGIALYHCDGITGIHDQVWGGGGTTRERSRPRASARQPPEIGFHVESRSSRAVARPAREGVGDRVLGGRTVDDELHHDIFQRVRLDRS